jgi:hypothetical protein
MKTAEHQPTTRRASQVKPLRKAAAILQTVSAKSTKTPAVAVRFSHRPLVTRRFRLHRAQKSGGDSLRPASTPQIKKSRGHLNKVEFTAGRSVN